MQLSAYMSLKYTFLPLKIYFCAYLCIYTCIYEYKGVFWLVFTPPTILLLPLVRRIAYSSKEATQNCQIQMQCLMYDQ